MAKKTKATSAEEKLRALYDLQLIDSRIDRLRVVRGELPLEVEDLEDELAGLAAFLSGQFAAMCPGFLQVRHGLSAMATKGFLHWLIVWSVPAQL